VNIGAIIDVSVMQAVEAVLAMEADRYAKLRSIAHELAAKHIRGDVACTACAAICYGGGLKHNDGCLVVKLQQLGG